MTTNISEIEAIYEAANLYNKALHTGDTELLKKAFHPQAMMYGPGMTVPIQGLFDYVKANPAPQNSGEPHKCFITKIDYVGNAASVEMLEEAYQGVNYINYFQLLKLEDKWIIVSKSFDVIKKD